MMVWNCMTAHLSQRLKLFMLFVNEAVLRMQSHCGEYHRNKTKITSFIWRQRKKHPKSVSSKPWLILSAVAVIFLLEIKREWPQAIAEDLKRWSRIHKKMVSWFQIKKEFNGIKEELVAQKYFCVMGSSLRQWKKWTKSCTNCFDQQVICEFALGSRNQREVTNDDLREKRK